MSVLQDAKFAFRSFRNRPLQAVAVIAMLVLGIGTTTAVYTVLHQLVLEPLPYSDGSRMVYLWKTHSSLGFSVTPSPDELRAWESASSIEGLEIYQRDRRVAMRGGRPWQASVALIRPSLFSFLGRHPVVGRQFVEEDMAAGAAGVAILSHSLWRSQYGASEEVLGRSLELDEEEFEIVGVMSPDFRFPSFDVDVWVPLALDPQSPPRGLNNIALLRDEATLKQTEAELQAILAGVSGSAEGPEWRIVIYRPGDLIGTRAQAAIWILLAAVILVLLVACANAGNLMLAQGTARARQLALRAALGASRGRLFRHLLVESLILALAGGGGGLVLALWTLDWIRAWRPHGLDELATVTLDSDALLFTLLTSVATSLLFGLLPALRLSRPDLVSDLREAGTPTAGRASPRPWQVFVVAQIAICTVLIVGAGLLTKSFIQLQRVDPGFNPEGIVACRISLPEQRYPSEISQMEFFRSVRDRLAASPAVDQVTYAMGVPPGVGVTGGRLEIEGRSEQLDSPASFIVNVVMPEYFNLLEIPLRGRAFSPEEIGKDPSVVIINRAMEQRFWGSQDAVGSRIRLGSEDDWMTVVGVAGNVRASGLRDQGKSPHLYYPFGTFTPSAATLIVKADRHITGISAQLRAAVWEVDHRLPVPEIERVEATLLRSIEKERFTTALFSTFSLIALMMSLLGLYGVMSYWVAARRREIGVRRALGAQGSTILAMVLRSGTILAVGGIAVGLTASLWLTRWLTTQLAEVTPQDPVVLGLAAGLLWGFTSAATLVPAWRATRVDPVDALRTE